MSLIWGVILIIISSLAWLGQLISAINVPLAARLGLTELEADIDPAFYADVRGGAYWNMLVLWTLPAAGVLLVLNNPVWIYFGLVGSGMFLYFAGLGIVVRRQMQQHGIRIGSAKNLKVGSIFLWGLTAIITMVIAIVKLSIS